MKLFNKKAEKRIWLALLYSIPFLFFVLWMKNGKIGLMEVIITTITLIIGILIMYFVRWYSNKN